MKHWFAHRRKLALKSQRYVNGNSKPVQTPNDSHCETTKDTIIKEEVQEKFSENTSQQQRKESPGCNGQPLFMFTLPMITVNNDLYQRALQQNIRNLYARNLYLRMMSWKLNV